MDNLLNHDIQAKKMFLRKEYRRVRKNISFARKSLAGKNATSSLLTKMRRFSSICSFASHHEELDLTALNRELAGQKKLLLPRIAGNLLQARLILNLDEDLEKGPLTTMQPKNSCPIFEEAIDCILVPAIAFDSGKHRLGFGKGYYDRFLALHSKSWTIGVGFKEQLTLFPLPLQPHDVAVCELQLF